tara:strand:- start:1394 stop:2566 length:1173 start_codon:yes stop_codon:yes gene_type:complete
MSIWSELINENKKLLIGIFAGVVTIIVVAFIVEPKKQNLKISDKKSEVLTTDTFNDDFFDTVPVPEEPKEEPKKVEIEEKVEEEKPKPNFRKVLSQKELEVKEAYKDEIQRDDLTRETLSQLYLAELHQDIATESWVGEQRFEYDFKDTPITTLKKQINRKKVEPGTFGTEEEFCELGEDCSFAGKPTNLEHTILPGSIIPITLTQTLVSDMPAPVCVGQVSRDITGYHGDKILIPMYSRAICKVLPVADPNQERLQVVFTDIFTPTGVRIQGAFAGADMVGSEGAVGEVNTRFLERIGFPLLTATVPIVMAYTLPDGSTADDDRRNSAIEGVSATLQPVIHAELDRNINTKYRITIKGGTMMNLVTANVLNFKPTKEGFFMPSWQDNVR